jgi:hypothetical protein
MSLVAAIGLLLAWQGSADAGGALAAANPRWQFRFSSTAFPGTLTSVVAFGPRNVWAAGAVTPARRPTSALVLRWNGASWTRVRLGRRNLAFGFATVAGSSRTNIWLFGSWLLRWDGSHWHKVPAPTAIGAGELSPVVLGPANVWMYGRRLEKSLGKHYCVSTIWHWNADAGNRGLSHDSARLGSPRHRPPASGLSATAAPAPGPRSRYSAGTAGHG